MEEIKYDKLLECLNKSDVKTTVDDGNDSYSFDAVINDAGYRTVVVHPNEQRIEIRELKYAPNDDIYINLSNIKIHIAHEDSHVTQQIHNISPVFGASAAMPINDDAQLALEASEVFIRSFDKVIPY